MGGLIIILSLVSSLFLTQPPAEEPAKREFRAVWVASYHNIDWPSKRGLSSEEQQNEFVQIAKQQKDNGMNALVVQIRPCGDAFYQSEFSQWSEWLTGTQGNPPAPYYDPLSFMVEETHQRNMEFHAWMNPFRAISHDRFSSVSPKHITHQKPEWFFKYGPKTFFNPGIPEVRNYLAGIVAEVVRNYDVDGIHFDDYFYPYRTDNEPIPDQKTFLKYRGDFTNIDDWRRHNIDLFVKQVADSIQAIKPHVKFGISPIGIWRNKAQDPEGSVSQVSHSSYDGLYADVRKWLKEGWIDYVAPQLYWSTRHPYANYSELLPWWAKNSFDRHLYVGHAMFKVKDNQSRYWDNPNQLELQLKLKKAHPEVSGSIFYSANSFTNNPYDVNRKLREGDFKFPALIPAMRWKDSIPPLPPEHLYINQHDFFISLNWEKPAPAADGEQPNYYVVYRFAEDEKINMEKSSAIIAVQRDTKLRDQIEDPTKSYTYIVTSVDRLHNESLTSTAITVKFDMKTLSLVTRSRNTKIIRDLPELDWVTSRQFYRNFPVIKKKKKNYRVELRTEYSDKVPYLKLGK